jgi:hypothetical protein
MGLDMYLIGKKFIPSYDDEGKTLSNQIREHLKLDENYPVFEVSVEIGYWRKANAIHRWFVQNIQEGEDDCRSYEVSREELSYLRDICTRVLANHELAEELLPTSSGFFFGELEYDDWYFQGIENTLIFIDRALKLSPEWNIEYLSSW